MPICWTDGLSIYLLFSIGIRILRSSTCIPCYQQFRHVYEENSHRSELLRRGKAVRFPSILQISVLLVRLDAGKVMLCKIFIERPKTQLQGPQSLLPLVYAGAATNGRDKERKLTAETLSV